MSALWKPNKLCDIRFAKDEISPLYVAHCCFHKIKTESDELIHIFTPFVCEICSIILPSIP